MIPTSLVQHTKILLPILEFSLSLFPHKISKSDDIPATDFSCGNTALTASAKPKLAG